MAEERSGQGYDEVLSSVRRLVESEAGRVAGAEAGKLLLTPALRVAEAAPDSTGGDAGERDFPTLQERIAELEAAVGQEPAEWEPDGSEDQAQHAPNAVVLPLHSPTRRPASELATNEADLVFAVPGEDAAAEDDRDRSGPDAVPDHLGDATPAAPAGPPPFASFRHRGQAAEPPAANRVHDDDETALIDEGALRDLVAEIVREELQGGLGERITRNVRKLVRAEIQRAFAARDLD